MSLRPKEVRLAIESARNVNRKKRIKKMSEDEARTRNEELMEVEKILEKDL